MSKKGVENNAGFEEAFEKADSNMTDEESLASLNFNVDDEYKPELLISKGTYCGSVTNVYYDRSKYCIVWDFCLSHNDGVYLSDNTTPIDGTYVSYRNWLPKPGDENERTKSGKSSKRQSKINMLQDFQRDMDVDMTTPAKIATALFEGHWIGMEVALEVDIDEYQGRFRNVVNRCKRV